MARGQGAARRGGPSQALSARQRIAVLVRDRREAEAALALEAKTGLEVVLVSPPGAAGQVGVGYLQALGELVGRAIVVDCGLDAGLVLAGLRTGSRRLLFRGEPVLLAKLRDIAQQLGAEVLTPAELPADIRPHPWGWPEARSTW